MKGVLVAVGIVFAVVFFVGGCGALSAWNSYNNLVALSENVDSKWGQVENVYQRRADLIPNLVATVQGYAAHERETFTAVTEARAKVGQISISAKDLTPENLQKFQAAQDALSGALSRLMVVVEKYPVLKANKLFLGLMTQLEGSENRVAVARRDYNEAAREHNTYAKRFPANMVANFFGFKEKPYFKADENAKKAPKVEFSGSGGKK